MKEEEFSIKREREIRIWSERERGWEKDEGLRSERERI